MIFCDCLKFRCINNRIYPTLFLIRMKKLKIGIVDLVSKGPNKTLWSRIMHANMASIMPQVIATWCEQDGHDVKLICYTGLEKLDQELPRHVDVVFICAFSQAALLSYALSNYFRSNGAV